MCVGVLRRGGTLCPVKITGSQIRACLLSCCKIDKGGDAVCLSGNMKDCAGKMRRENGGKRQTTKEATGKGEATFNSKCKNAFDKKKMTFVLSFM